MDRRVRSPRKSLVWAAGVVPAAVLAEQEPVSMPRLDQSLDQPDILAVGGRRPDPVVLDPASAIRYGTVAFEVGLGLGVNPDEPICGKAL